MRFLIITTARHICIHVRCIGADQNIAAAPAKRLEPLVTKQAGNNILIVHYLLPSPGHYKRREKRITIEVKVRGCAYASRDSN